MLAGAVQMTSGGDLAANLDKARELVTEGAARGAKLIVLPENFAFLGEDERGKFQVAEPIPGDGPILTAMRELARTLAVDLVLGGMPEAQSPTHVHNSSVYVDAGGEIRGIYRKIHLFDVAIPDGATFTESASVRPGEQPIVIDAGHGKVGLTICYDLRFPELYRALTHQGARILTVPAAFTLHTGRDHWHALLRARAIENLAFVIAAAQFGRHNPKRVTYGHACIIDPWGHILAEVGDHEGVAVAELDFEYQERLRRELPALDHRRL
ncbi:MAG: Aliphatic amidase AmiE [Myxococcales bacterium]|nr:Aliphatic amidase AmiE [Myxococcales bacterium]